MKKILIPILILILTACSTPQVTTPFAQPPIATVVPTPTVRPQFIEIQNRIAASGECLTLRADGTIEEQTADGAKIMTGLSTDNNGMMILTVNGEVVELNPADVSFGNGVLINGYTQNEGGKWTAIPAWIVALPEGTQAEVGVDGSLIAVNRLPWMDKFEINPEVARNI